MDKQISREARLRGITACLEATTAKANRELQACGDWSFDWGSQMGQYEQQIEDLLAAAEHAREGGEGEK